MKKITIIGLTILNIIGLVLLILIIVSDEDYSNKILNDLNMQHIVERENKIVLADRITDELLNIKDEHIYCDNKYEEEIINHDPNKVFKLIKLKIDGYDSFMLIVYDPSKIKMMTSKEFNTKDNSGKEKVIDMVARYGAIAGTNGGGFYDDGHVSKDIPIGYVIKDGEVIWDYNNGRKGLIIGFDNDNKLIMLDKVTGKQAIEQGMRDGLEFGPVLMRDGIITNDSKLPRWEGRASRLVMAQREDGIVIFLATNGGTVGGPRMSRILSELKKYDVINAANLDGGASTQLVVEGELLTNVKSALGKPVSYGRLVVDGWGIFE